MRKPLKLARMELSLEMQVSHMARCLGAHERHTHPLPKGRSA